MGVREVKRVQASKRETKKEQKGSERDRPGQAWTKRDGQKILAS